MTLTNNNDINCNLIQIPVMTSADVNNDRNNVRETLINDRIAIDCQDLTSGSVLRKRLRFACINSCSVRNKIAVIIDHMVDSGIDICTITETWLKECDSVSIAGLSTAGFVFRSFPRQSGRSGGGTGAKNR